MDFENADLLEEARLMTEPNMVDCNDFNKCEDCPLVKDCRDSDRTEAMVFNEAIFNALDKNGFLIRR